MTQDKYQISVGTFDRLADKYAERFMHFRHYEETFEKILRYFHAEHGKVLDIGCGPGNISAWLTSKRPELQITGTDLSPAMVNLARQHVPFGNFQVLDARDTHKVDGSYDLIVCGFCIPYLDIADTRLLLTRIAERLKPSGILYLSYIDGDPANNGLQTNGNGDSVFSHYYTATLMAEMMASAGLVILSADDRTLPDSDSLETFIYAAHASA